MPTRHTIDYVLFPHNTAGMLVITILLRSLDVHYKIRQFILMMNCCDLRQPS
jgi:hypothetical protein